MVKIAAADHVKQHGFDETQIDGQATMNQWVSIEENGGTPEIVHMDTAGILVGGTAAECADHIEQLWNLAQEAILFLWEELTSMGVNADELVPLTKGGVQMLKLCSEMHDTCNTANAVVAHLRRMKIANGIDVLGEEG